MAFLSEGCGKQPFGGVFFSLGASRLREPAAEERTERPTTAGGTKNSDMSSASDKTREDLLQVTRELLASAESIVPGHHLGFQKSLERANEMKKATRHVQLALQFVQKFHEEDAALRAESPLSAPAGPAQARARPTADRKDAFKGDTQTIPLPKLISFLGMQQKTGVLEIVAPTETFDLTFDNGDIVEATSDRPPEGTRVGDLLVELGRISAEDLSRILKEYDAASMRLGQALERAGLIQSEDLCDVLRSQVQGMFLRITAAKSATFAFFDGLPTIFDRRIRINTNQLLLESARVQDEATL